VDRTDKAQEILRQQHKHKAMNNCTVQTTE